MNVFHTVSRLRRVGWSGLAVLVVLSLTARVPAEVLVDGNTPGYYNNSLGTMLDGTGPQFPLPLFSGGGDPTINPADEPDLSAASALLGEWLAPVPVLNGNWSHEAIIPSTWALDTESAILYTVFVPAPGISNVVGNFDADNGLFVWVNGQYKFGAIGPGMASPAGEFEYSGIDLGSFPPGTNYVQVLRQDSGIATGYQIRITGLTNLSPPDVVNILFNGDFEAGNVGFATDHTFIPAGSEDPGPGYYSLVTNPPAFNGFFVAYGDHTSGGGQMLVVDCATSPSQALWRQAVAVVPGADYRFSGWVANPYGGSPAVLEVLINGQKQGQEIGSELGVWQQFERVWNSGTVTQAVLEIRSASTDYVGNDVTLDDLVFRLDQPGQMLPPVIVNVSPGAGTNGASVTLTGANFSPVAESNIVYFGAVRAVVTAATATSLTVSVPVGATFAPPSVTVGGLTAQAQASFIPTFPGGNAISVASFAPRVNLASGSGPIQTAIADLDGDGRPDLAVTDDYANTISLYRNVSVAGTLEASSFESRVVLPASAASYSPYILVAADVDGDGKLDLVTTDIMGNTVSVFRNQSVPGSLSASSFAPFVSFAVGGGPRQLAVMDLDADGRPEIVTANYDSSTVSVLRNTGTTGLISANSFAPRFDLAAGAGTHGVAVADLDGDGKPDLVTANGVGASMSLFRNIGSGPLSAGSFAPEVQIAAPEYAHFLRAADLDGDGKPDLILTSYLSVPLTVYRNQSAVGVLNTGSFAPGVGFALSGRGHTVSAGDLNGDGKVDLAVDTEIGDSVALLQNLAVPGSFTSGSLAARVDLATGWNAWGSSVGDLDGDGRPDVVFANTYEGTISICRNLSFFANDPKAPPFITVQPVDQTVPAGTTAQFSVTAAGGEPLVYQWFKSGDPIDGGTTNTLVLADVQPDQAGDYCVVVSNANGVATSSNALLTVLTFPPVITMQPADVSVYEGKTAMFGVQVTGTAPFRCQWDKDGMPISSATNLSYSLANVQFADAGNFRVIVANDYGSATSRVASLTVRPAPVCVEVPADVVAWWPGERNLWDVVNGFDGHANVTPMYGQGIVGSAFQFGPGRFVLAPSVPELDLGAADGFTFEGWIKPDSVSSIFGICGWAGSGSSSTYPVGSNLRIIPPGMLEAQLVRSNGQIVPMRTTVPVLQAGQWQHVALGYDTGSGQANIFVNGVSVAQTNLGPAALRTSGNFRIGDAGGPSFLGLIDESTLYRRALPQAEIRSIFLADEAGKCPPPPPPCLVTPAGIAAWWRGESNALDSVAGDHGSILPTNYPVALTYEAGRVNAAFSFKGANHVSVPRSDILDVGKAGGLTIEAWINPNYFRPMPIVEWTDSNSFGASLWMSYYRGPSVLEANLIDSAGGLHIIQSPANTLSYNHWQHVAVTYDKTSGLAALYVNGNPVATTNLGVFTPRTDLDLKLGFHPTGPSYTGLGSPPPSQVFFSGAMDELAIYRRALNPDEIRTIVRSRPGRCLELAPAIGREPQDQVAQQGGTATLDVVAGGTPPLDYQWLLGGQPVAGANAATLPVAPAALSDGGLYSVIVSNVFGATTSRVATLTVLPANQCLPTSSGAVAFWRGESNTVDELGHHPASWTNTTPGYTTQLGNVGEVGTAFRFSGYSHLQVPANPDLNVGAGGGFTVEGWIKPDVFTGAQPLVDWNDLRGTVGVGIMYARTGPGVLEVTLTDTNAVLTQERIITFATPWYTLGNPTNPNPAWAHLALTFEKVSGRAVLFLNGKQILERTIGQVQGYSSQGQRVPFTPVTTGNLYFGWRPSGVYAGPRFRGSMDEMTVYYRALTPLELQSIYVVGSSGKCTPQPSCLPLAEGVAGWWRGESNLLDSVNTNSGVAVPGISFSYTNGVAGQAMYFASGQQVRIPAAPALDVGAGDGMTFESWINPATSSAYALAAWNSGAGEQGVSFGISPTRGPNYFEANLVDTAGTSHVMSTPFRALSITNWQHVAVTYDKLTGQGVIFVNGSPVTVTNLGVFSPRTTSTLYLGHRPPGNYPGSGFGYSGGMDEVMIHGRALSSSEVTAHYRNPASRCMEPPVIVQQPVGMRVNAGSDVTLSVLGVGNPLLRYQWFQGRGPVYDSNQKASTHAQGPTLTLTNIAGWQEGDYAVVVSNAFGVVTSSTAMLLVNYPPVADASATESLLISPNESDAVAVLDGSRSSDPDSDTLAYQWFLNSPGTPLATGVVAVVTLPIGAHSIMLAVSDGLLTRTNPATVEVITTSQALDLLTELVESGEGNPQPLVTSMRAALAAIDRSQPATAINQLEAFINKVFAQVQPHDPALAAQLIADAQAIIDVLNAGAAPSPTALEITSLSHGNSGRPHLNIKGANGRTLIVETSTNLVDWEKVGVAGRCGDCAYEFDDTSTQSAGARYYRVVSPK